MADKCKDYLINNRKIKPEILEKLEENLTLMFQHDKVYITMKDLDGNKVGLQERCMDPININGKKLKSKTKSGDKIGYFYIKIDFSAPIIIVEGEIDFLSLAHLPNIIGIQGISNLRKLVRLLQVMCTKPIYLLTDNDNPADLAINKMIESGDVNLKGVYDSRICLGDYNDVNDCICAGNEINIEIVYQEGKCLQDFVNDNINEEQFLVWKPNGVNIDHNEFAKYVKSKYEISAVDESLFIFENGIWTNLSKSFVEKIVLKEMENLLTKHIGLIRNNDRKQIFEFLLTHAEDKKMKDVLNKKNVNEINLNDGILDTNTWKTRQYEKSDYKFYKLDYNSDLLFGDNNKPGRWLAFLEQVLEGWGNKKNIIQFIQEFIGLLFIPSVKYEKALLLYGNGANGKGLLLDVIRYVLGMESSTSIGLHEINKDQNLFLLLGKLVNFDFDLQQGVQLDSGIIKKIISGEPIVGKVVYSKPVAFTPYARLLLATNELPYLKTVDYSIRRRFVFLNLKKSFVGQEDPTLKEKLKEEKNAIFVWAIEGLKRLISRGGFEIPNELKSELDKFIKENDSVEQFLEEGILDEGDHLFIENSLVYQLYSDFCKRHGFKPLGLVKLGHRLVSKGFKRHTTGKSRGIEGLGVLEYPHS